MRTGNAIVDEITQMRFEGIKIDHRWLGHPLLCKTDGKLVQEGKSTGFWFDAAYVLAEILYFYSAKVERDPDGQVTSVKKRFDGEVLYQDYETWAAKIGLTKKQLQNVIAFLKKKGLIEAWAQPVTLRNGSQTNNLPHFEPVPEKIRELTFGDFEAQNPHDRGVPQMGETPPSKPRTSTKKGDASPKSGRPPAQKSETPPPKKGDNYRTVRTNSSTSKSTTTTGGKAAAAVVDDAHASGQLTESLTEKIYALGTGLSRRVIKPLVEANPEHAALWVEWWPRAAEAQESYWQDRKGSAAGALRRRLEDPDNIPRALLARQRAEERRKAHAAAMDEKKAAEAARIAKERASEGEHDANLRRIWSEYAALGSQMRAQIDEIINIENQVVAQKVAKNGGIDRLDQNSLLWRDFISCAGRAMQDFDDAFDESEYQELS